MGGALLRLLRAAKIVRLLRAAALLEPIAFHFEALRCFGWVVAHASVVMRWLGTGELGGPTGAIVPSPDVAGGVLPVDLWTTRLRCPQIHRHRDHNSKAIFHLVAPDPITPYPPQIPSNLKR